MSASILYLKKKLTKKKYFVFGFSKEKKIFKSFKMIFGYLLSIYILLVGYLYPLTHYIYQSQMGADSDPTFTGKDWTQYFATVTAISIVDGVIGPILSVLFFPWYAILQISLITALVTVKDLDKQIFQGVSSVVLGNRSLFENVETIGKVKVVNAWQSGFSFLWNTSTKVLLNTKTRFSSLGASRSKKIA